MTKFTKSILIIILIPFLSFGQITFQTNIAIGHSGATGSLDAMYQLSDHSYCVSEIYVNLANCNTGGASIYPFSAHLSNTGNIISQNYPYLDMIFNKDEMLSTVGNKILIQIDTNLDTLVYKPLAGNAANYFFQKPTIDNFLIAININGTPKDTLEKMDTAANVIYEKVFTVTNGNNYCLPSADSGVYLIKNIQGNYLYNGYYRVNTCVIVKYNSSLDSVWSKTMSPNAAIYQSPDYHLIFLQQDSDNQKHITTFDYNLDTLSKMNFNDSVRWETVCALNNGEFVYGSSIPFKNAFGKVNSIGNTFWRRQLYPFDTTDLDINKIMQTSDGGFLIGGYHDNMPTDSIDCFAPIRTTVVIKTDNAGNVTGIKELAKDINSILLFPNPASDNLTLLIPDNVAKATVKVFNMIGSLQFSSNVSRQRTDMDVSRLAKGAYIIEVSYNDAIMRQKFVKE